MRSNLACSSSFFAAVRNYTLPLSLALPYEDPGTPPRDRLEFGSAYKLEQLEQAFLEKGFLLLLRCYYSLFVK